jgi:adenylate cyclase
MSSLIGHELNADYILEGSVRREGQAVRVTAQLIRVSDQSPLWAHNYDREFTGLLAMQRELGIAIAQQVRINLAPNYANQPAVKYVPNAEAYELYLQGLFYFNMRTADAIRKSIEYFKRSTDKDTGFALAYAGQASAYIGYAVFSPQESYPKAAAAALRALELDDGLAEAHAALGAEKAGFEFDWAAAETQLNRAIALNPNSAYARFLFSIYYLTPHAQLQQSILEMKKVLELDPLSPIYNTVLGFTYYFARQYEQALEQFGKTLNLYPDFFVAHTQLAWLYAQLGDFPNAITEITKTRLLEGGSVQKVTADELVLRKAFADRGAEGFWQAVRGTIQPGHFYAEVFFTPQIFARLGDTDMALDALQRSYEQRVFFVNFIKVDPAYDSLRSDPRFANLVQRMGLAP